MNKFFMFSVLFTFVLVFCAYSYDPKETKVDSYLATILSGQKLETFLSSGNNIEMVDEFGYTTLHWVASYQNSSTLRQWIKAGANVNAANNWGTTPIFHAVQSYRLDNVEALLEAGININHKQNNGQTVLIFSIVNLEWVLPDIVLSLINHGADVNALNFEGKSPLNLLRARKDFVWGDAEIAIEKLLISKGARDIAGFDGQDTSNSTGTKTKSDRHTDSKSSPSCSNTNRQGSRRTYESRDDDEDCNQQDNYNPIR